MRTTVLFKKFYANITVGVNGVRISDVPDHPHRKELEEFLARIGVPVVGDDIVHARIEWAFFDEESGTGGHKFNRDDVDIINSHLRKLREAGLLHPTALR